MIFNYTSSATHARICRCHVYAMYGQASIYVTGVLMRFDDFIGWQIQSMTLNYFQGHEHVFPLLIIAVAIWLLSMERSLLIR